MGRGGDGRGWRSKVWGGGVGGDGEGRGWADRLRRGGEGGKGEGGGEEVKSREKVQAFY